MTLQELAFVTQVYELILTGNTNCGIINKAYKLVNPKENLKSRKQKIKAIKEFWERLADETIKQYLINKQLNPQNDDRATKE